MISKIYRSFEETFIKSWWMILFILGCYLCYEQGLRKRDHDFFKLHLQYVELQNESRQAKALQENLLLQINSQSDPNYVELTLMKGLGLVAEGETKVLFTDQPELLKMGKDER